MTTTNLPTRLRQVTADGWANILTGLGIRGRDKRMSAAPAYYQMTEQEVEYVYASDDLAKRIVNRLPEEMTRKWFKLRSSTADPEQLHGVMQRLDELEAKSRITKALKWARLYGGAGVIVGVDGIQQSNQPVNMAAIRRVSFLTVMQRYELQPVQPINGNPEDPNFGMPDAYYLQPRSGGIDNKGRSINNVLVHHSRILRFDGEELPEQLFRSNNYWHASVFQRLTNPLRNYQTSHDSLAVLLHDFSQAVYKIKDLADIVSAKDGLDLLNRRLEAVDRCRSVLGAVLIGEEEEFERKQTPLTGIEHAFKQINNRLVAATDMPHTKLLGESPSGLGATGESEQADWYDYVSSQQETMLKPMLERLVRMIFLSKDGPTRGVEPSDWEIVFNPLSLPTQEEEVSTRKSQAEVDKIYIESGVLSPDEVARNRFADGGFNYDTKIDVDSRPVPMMPMPDDESDQQDDVTAPGVEQ